MGVFINNYINSENPICRDGKQYAVYLFQILCGCKRVKIDFDNYTNKKYEVSRAYYEASFLRDYFNDAKDKADFNARLLRFANRKLRSLFAGEEEQGALLEKVDAKAVSADEVYNVDAEPDYTNPGFDMGKHINGWTKEERLYRNPIARWMMNVKPDIALLLKRRGIKRSEYRMHFIDCKYVDGIDTYPALIGRFDATGKKVKTCKRLVCSKQQIESYVLEFLLGPCTEEADTLGLQVFGPAKESDVPIENTAIAIEPGFVSMACFVNGRNKHLYTKKDRVVTTQRLQEYCMALFDEEKVVKEPKVILGDAVDLVL